MVVSVPCFSLHLLFFGAWICGFFQAFNFFRLLDASMLGALKFQQARFGGIPSGAA